MPHSFFLALLVISLPLRLFADGLSSIIFRADFSVRQSRTVEAIGAEINASQFRRRLADVTSLPERLAHTPRCRSAVQSRAQPVPALACCAGAPTPLRSPLFFALKETPSPFLRALRRCFRCKRAPTRHLVPQNGNQLQALQGLGMDV